MIILWVADIVMYFLVIVFLWLWSVKSMDGLEELRKDFAYLSVAGSIALISMPVILLELGWI
jgi:cytochrome c biogenesis protein CcdA